MRERAPGSTRDRGSPDERQGGGNTHGNGYQHRTSEHVPGFLGSMDRVAIGLWAAGLRAGARMMIALARVTPVGLDEVLRLKAGGRRIVLVSWHGYDLCNLAVYPGLYGRGSRAVIMAPMTREGRIMERLAMGLGYDVIPVGVDATSPVSARGVVEMVSRIKDGYDGMIAVDGPGGPPEQAKLGAAVIAKRAGAVIVPTVVAGSSEIRVGSRWDKHLLIPPRARMIMHFGPLIDTCPATHPNPSPEDIRQRIEAAMGEGTRRARTLLHPSPIRA